VAESEGALVAQTYLVSYHDAPVSTLVMASPLLDPGRVSYPVGGSTVGFGLPSRYGMQLLGSAYQSVAPIDLSPQSAFLKSVDQLAPSLQRVLDCPTPGVRHFAVLPLADATAAAPRTSLPFGSAVVPAFHGGLIGTTSADRLVATVLRGRVPVGNGVLRALDAVIAASASAWQVPPLVLSDHSRNAPSSHSLASSCSALSHALMAR
jgi:hypothetical protein